MTGEPPKLGKASARARENVHTTTAPAMHNERNYVRSCSPEVQKNYKSQNPQCLKIKVFGESWKVIHARLTSLSYILYKFISEETCTTNLFKMLHIINGVYVFSVRQIVEKRLSISVNLMCHYVPKEYCIVEMFDLRIDTTMQNPRRIMPANFQCC